MKYRFHFGRLLQGGILLGFSLYLIKVFKTGEVHRLVAPHIAIFLEITLGIVLVLSFYTLATIFQPDTSCDHEHTYHHDHGHDHDHFPKPKLSWLLYLLPIILGLTGTTKALGVSAIESYSSNSLIKASQSTNVASATAQPDTPNKTDDSKPSKPVLIESTADPSTPPKIPDGTLITPLDVMTDFIVAPEHYFGHTYKMQGIVYHPPTFATNRFVLVRYSVFCCVADASPIGIAIETDKANTYSNDTWVEVEGDIQKRNIPELDQIGPTSWAYGKADKPALIVKNIKKIPEPDRPYAMPTIVYSNKK